MFTRRFLMLSLVVLSMAVLAQQAMAKNNALTRLELESMLRERDAKIARLEKTVNLVLERLAALDLSEPAIRARPLKEPPAGSSSPELQALQARVNSAAPATDQQRDATHVDVDEDAAERALERTLVQRGSVLLEPGVVEIEPSFSYTYNEAEFPALVMGLLGTNKVESSRFDASLNARVGLPLRSQLELSLPYRWRDIDTVGAIGGAPVSRASMSGNGLGDLGVGIASTLLRESGWVPDIVARASWNTGTGERVDDGVFLGGGFASVTGSLNFVKRSDPLAFFGSVGYRTFYEDGSLEPGDQFLTSFGLALAASPESSLFMSIDNQFVSEFKSAGLTVPGSDLTLSTLNLGATTILSEGVLLRLVAGIGLTDAAPDYSVGISLPVRTSTLSEIFAGQ